MAQDQARVAGAERPRSLDVDALANALRLRADESRRERPVDDPDDHDDVPRAAAEQSRDDDDQGDVGNHEEVVREPHEGGVRPPAEEARDDADRSSDECGYRTGAEADQQRDPRAGDE